MKRSQKHLKGAKKPSWTILLLRLERLGHSLGVKMLNLLGNINILNEFASLLKNRKFLNFRIIRRGWYRFFSFFLMCNSRLESFLSCLEISLIRKIAIFPRVFKLFWDMVFFYIFYEQFVKKVKINLEILFFLLM